MVFLRRRWVGMVIEGRRSFLNGAEGGDGNRRAQMGFFRRRGVGMVIGGRRWVF